MNAKKEFIQTILNKAIVKCATIKLDIDLFDKHMSEQIINLKVNYTKKEYDQFLNNLDFDYDKGYGNQELFGTIWLEDNSWIERGEYDGLEWWEHRQLPTIPNQLL